MQRSHLRLPPRSPASMDFIRFQVKGLGFRVSGLGYGLPTLNPKPLTCMERGALNSGSAPAPRFMLQVLSLLGVSRE